MSNILDPKFKYVSASKTDVRKTIRREQLRLKAEEDARKKREEESRVVVVEEWKARRDERK